jgi:hypothetical protein
MEALAASKAAKTTRRMEFPPKKAGVHRDKRLASAQPFVRRSVACDCQ